MSISEGDYLWAANELQCDLNAIIAVAKVESGGSGFLPNGEPKILFEAHHFSRLTNNRFDVSHPAISSVKWNRKLYSGSGIGEHLRLQDAVKLDKTAALKSASWGKFQIMGFNWEACGCESLRDFITAMYASESRQLKAFVGYIKHNPKLLRAIQTCSWRAFASIYNGPAYETNRYHLRLAEEYRKANH